MRRRAKSVATVVVLGILAALHSGRAVAEGIPEHGIKELVQDLLDEEIWRSGGPRQDRLLSYFQRAVESGSPEAVAAIEDTLWPLFHRRWLDPTPFAEYLPQLKELSLRGGGDARLWYGWKEEVAIWKMSTPEREHVYSDLLRTRKDNRELGLTWLTAAYRACQEHLDGLLPEIEVALESSALSPEASANAGVLRAVFVPLAVARSGDWVEGYMAIIQEELKKQTRQPDNYFNSPGNRVIREASLELAHSARGEILERLRTLWRSIPNSDYTRPERQTVWTKAAAKGLCDIDYPRHTPAAMSLLRAIWALGDEAFQEKNLRRKEKLERDEAQLVEAGWFRPAAEVK